MCKKLKKVMEACGIEKALSFQSGSYSFGTLLINAGICTESIAKFYYISSGKGELADARHATDSAIRQLFGIVSVSAKTECTIWLKHSDAEALRTSSVQPYGTRRSVKNECYDFFDI